MKIRPVKNKGFFIALLGIAVFLILCLLELKAIYWAELDPNVVLSLANGTAINLYFLFGGCALAILYLQSKNPTRLSSIISWIQSFGRFRWLVFFLISLFPVWFFYFSAWGFIFVSPIFHIWCFANVIVLLNILSCESKESAFSFKTIIISILIAGSIFLIGGKMKEVVNYPFSLYWSEGNRLWDYSLLFAKDKYLYSANKPIFAFIDLGRQSLWGLPFLIKDASITLLRFWNVLLFTVSYILLGYLVFKRKNTSKSLALFLGLWVFIFLNQGPIYTPLIFCALLVLFAADAPWGWSLLLLIASGYYANLTRYTWSFAPAIWGVLLSLFNNKKNSAETNQIDWIRAITSGVAGLFGGLVLPTLMPLTSGGTTQEFQGAILSSAQSTLQSQALIWSRLLPNETYAPGIGLGTLLATLPLILILIVFIKQTRQKFNIWQFLAACGSCLVFLAVGLIASVKIGGGSNLHNLDMFFINLLLLAGVAWKRKGQDWLTGFRNHRLIEKFLMSCLVIFPLYPTLLIAYPLNLPSRDSQIEALTYIQKSVREAKNIGEVLFIDQRQLLTFGQVSDVSLVPDYEKKYLMNQAMSGDQVLFKKFYDDLRNHRFSLIINEPSFIDYQSEDFSFGTENDVWVEWVAKPLACYYRSLRTYKNLGVELLIPRVLPPDPSWLCP
jgi:hypothetical protein